MKLAVGILLTAVAIGAVEARPKPAVPLDPANAILNAFRSHNVVAIGEVHGNEQEHAFIRSLVRDPRFAASVNDVVVEFGNARYQDLMDRFVNGEEIPETSLRRVWQDTTVVGTTWDVPIYEEFFGVVRAVNAKLEPSRRLRVLLGDPPIDWSKVRSWEDVNEWDRDTHPADVIGREVVAKRRRALLIFGGLHFQRKNIFTNYDMHDTKAQTLLSLLEKSGEMKPFTIWPTDSFTDVAKLQPDVRSWQMPSMAILRGTVLGAADFTAYYPFEVPRAAASGDRVPIPRDRYQSLRMEDQFDALLYLGPTSTMTPSRLSPALCADAEYMETRLCRLALMPNTLVYVGPPVTPPTERLKQYCATNGAK